MFLCTWRCPMIIRNVMTRNPYIISPESSVTEAKALMSKKNISKLPVVDKSNRLVGIITKNDLAKAGPSNATTLDMFEIGYLLSKLTVSKVMVKDVVTVSENEVVEDKTWCEISEDTKILGLNYFVCVDNSQKKLSPSINDESRAKKDTFLIRGYASRYVEIRVGYNNKKLNFSSVSDSYIITNVMKKDSTINITIEWKNKQ